MRRRRSGGPKHGKGGSNAWTIVLVLILGAAFIYTYQALDINSILFRPAVTSASPAPTPSVPRTSAPGSSPSGSPTAGDTPSAGASAAAPSPSGKITDEIKMNGGTLYCIQIGAFTQLDNARSFSDTSKAQGSAGYILKDDTLYRVFDSVYYSENDANAVRDSFRSGAYPDACVVNVKSTGFDWKVSASREQIDAIRQAITAIQFQTLALINIQKTAQQTPASASGYSAAAGGCAQALQNATQAMMKAVGQTKSAVILSLNDCLSNCATNLGKLTQNATADGNAFLSGLKYSIIDFLLALQNKVMQ